MRNALFDEAGELNPPKDPNRADICLEEEEEQALRQQVMSDLLLMYEKGFRLSPGFLRQMGHEEEATALEAILLNRPSPEEVEEVEELQEASTSTAVEKRQAGPSHFEVEKIVDEKPSTGRAGRWYLVRWAGYHPTWEPWRINGEIGDLVETWEPEATVRNTEAMVAWQEGCV